MTWQKLLAGWFIITLGAAAIAVIWLGDFTPLAMGRSALLVALPAAAVAAWSWLLWRNTTGHLARLEAYASSLPSEQATIPADLPPEFAALSAALRRTAAAVHSIIARANLELSRRETILAGMAEGVLAVDAELKVTFCNEAFAEAFRTPAPLPEGRPLYEIVREPDLRDMLLGVLHSSAAAKARLHLPAAEGHWFQIHALPLGGASASGAIAVLHDISDIQRQEQARKDFVANVSHELRTPLAAIRGYAETLLDGALDDVRHNRQFVEIIQAHAIRLNNIASDLLVLSELDTQTPDTPAERVELHDVIESALRTVEPAAALRNITIERSEPEDLAVRGNRFRLEQAVVNLLDNAVKFSRPRGTVIVSCTEEGEDEAALTVADAGIGIPSEDLARIFERFYRVDKARSRQAGGTGLGLSIVKETVERMGGSVAVESLLGQGSRFTLRLSRA